MRAAWAVLVAALATFPPALRAQRPEGAPRGENRQLLEQRVRARFAEVVRQRVGLTDAQMTRLEQANRKFEAQRRQLLKQERDVRAGLRSEVQAAERANQQRVSQLIDQIVRIQGDRVALLEEEQRELATFMTPVQRARYLGVQEQVRRVMEDMRRRQQPGESAGVRGRRPR